MNGVFHGKGKYICKGSTYIGDFVKGEFDGEGEFTWPDGSNYKG